MTAVDPASRPWLLDGRILGGWSGVRGIGTYLRSLLAAYGELGVAGRVSLLTARGLPMPDAAAFGASLGPRVPVLKRRIQPVADPFLVSLAMRRARPALYHAVEWAQPLVTGGVPVVLTVHDLIPFVFPHLYPWIRRERLLALRLARRADAIVVPSAATARDVERLGHVEPARIHVIPHGVEPRFSPAAPAAIEAVRRRLGLGDRRFLLSTGTLDERKRRDELIEAVSRVREEHDVTLVVAGDQGTYAPQLAAAIERHGLGAHTRVVGLVSTDDLVGLYSGAAALVFPTAYEGFGLPLLEALACGTYAVCFDNSSLPEVIGGAGVLVPDGDVAAMATAVSRLLADSEAERAARVARGRAWAREFTWERSARAHLAVYAELEGRSARRRLQ